MPDVCKKFPRNMELKLNGDKVRLEARPSSKDSRASSKSAYLIQGPSRPVSAVPRLHLYNTKDDYELSDKTRRPYSAGNARSVALRSGKTSVDSSLQSIDEIDSDLPSTELLKSLISEPIISWRDGQQLDTRQQPLKTTATNYKSDEDTSITDYSEEKFVLKPGLTGKPPLPKKNNKNSPRDKGGPNYSSDVQYQNWVDGAEKRTDDLLQQIRNDKNVATKSVELPTFVINDEDDDFKTSSGISFDSFFCNTMPSDKIITLTDRPLEKPKPKKQESKVFKPSVPKKASNVNHVEEHAKNGSNKKNKFTATAVRSCKDYEEQSPEVDSWMSQSSKDKDVEEWIDANKKSESKNDAIDDGTYDEINALLQILEEESHKSITQMQSIKTIVNHELHATINSIPTHDKPPKSIRFEEDKNDFVQDHIILPKSKNNAEKVKNVESPKPPKELKTSNNFKELLHFLDEVDKNSTQSLTSARERVNLTTQMIEGVVNLDTVPKIDDLLNCSQNDLCNQVVELNLRLKEKSSAIKTLQDELSSLREHVLHSKKQTEKIVKEKLQSQKSESDDTVRRHQKFIDQLIADKKSLSQQCESLLHEMKMLEEKFNNKIKAVEHKHQVEMQKSKDMHAAGEKYRRERWVESKTQKIKEMTVKSIEPEINSMTKRHEQELADLRLMHKREIEDIELKQARKMQKQCENIREQMTQEREKALAHEREVLRIRYESLAENEEKNFQEQRKRLQQEHANRISELDARIASVVQEKERAVKQVQEECEDQTQVLMRRHANEIKMMKETAEMELDSWKTNWRKQQELQLGAKEHLIREQCRKERDREIEAVIERLEAEANENRSQIEEACENRIRRIKEKFEKEVGDLETSEREAKDKYATIKAQLLESEDALITSRATLKHLEAQLKDAQGICEKLTSERSDLKESLKEEMKSEIGALEKEVERIKSERDAELQQVYARVKMAVARKDEMLAELTRDHVSLKEKCKYLESMLEQQRKEYLIK